MCLKGLAIAAFEPFFGGGLWACRCRPSTESTDSLIHVEVLWHCFTDMLSVIMHS